MPGRKAGNAAVRKATNSVSPPTPHSHCKTGEEGRRERVEEKGEKEKSREEEKVELQLWNQTDFGSSPTLVVF